MRNKRILKLCIAGLLIAVGIIIPMFSPLKIVLEPASFTLGSHIAIFIALFISPEIAVLVAIGTTLGFFLGGFPIVVVIRAASHIVFAIAGALWLRKASIDTYSGKKLWMFSLTIGLIHALCEFVVVSIFYMVGGMGEAYYTSGFLFSVILLVGLGTVVHSVVDFWIAYAIDKPLRKATSNYSL